MYVCMSCYRSLSVPFRASSSWHHILNVHTLYLYCLLYTLSLSLALLFYFRIVPYCCFNVLCSFLKFIFQVLRCFCVCVCVLVSCPSLKFISLLCHWFVSGSNKGSASTTMAMTNTTTKTKTIST